LEGLVSSGYLSFGTIEKRLVFINSKVLCDAVMPLAVLITPVENTDSIRPFQKQAVYLIMLLQLEDTNQDNINMLMKFAVQHDLKLSVIDEIGDDYLLPGKPLSPGQLTQLIEKSRKSGMIALENAHTFIRKAYDAK